MEQVMIHCKSDLSAFWLQIRDCFPENEIQLSQTQNLHSGIKIRKKHLSAFSKRLAFWIHKKISLYEIQNLFIELCLTEEEKTEFLSLALLTLNREEARLCCLLEKHLYSFLSEHDELSLDGFLRFAAQEHREEILLLLDECLDDLAVREEYWNFLELLHQFVETEESKTGDLIVSIRKDKEIRFYNQDGMDITGDCKKKFMEEFWDESFSMEDYILSVLILYLPKQIWVYGGQFLNHGYFFLTLHHIFGERVQVYEIPLQSI